MLVIVGHSAVFAFVFVVAVSRVAPNQIWSPSEKIADWLEIIVAAIHQASMMMVMAIDCVVAVVDLCCCCCVCC
jgi:hypothetical protein